MSKGDIIDSQEGLLNARIELKRMREHGGLLENSEKNVTLPKEILDTQNQSKQRDNLGPLPDAAPDSGIENNTLEVQQESKSRIQQQIDTWVDSLYENIPPPDKKDWLSPFSVEKDIIDGFRGDDNSISQGEVAAMVFESFCAHVEQHAGNPQERERLRAFLERLYEKFFSFSPNLTNWLEPGDDVLLAARANRTPESQGWFGTSMIGELVYELAFSSEERAERIAERLNQAPLAERLDAIDQLVTIVADASGNGEWAEPAEHNVEVILDRLEESDSSPIVRYAIDIARQLVHQQRENPSLGVLKRLGDQRESRISRGSRENLNREHEHLSKSLNPTTDLALNGTEHLLKISSDAVAIYDHSFIPQAYGRVEKDSLADEATVSLLALRTVRQMLSEHAFSSPQAVARTLTTMESKFVRPMRQKKEKGAPTTLGESWTALNPELSAQEWERLFELGSAAARSEADNAWFLEQFNRLVSSASEFLHRCEEYLSALEEQESDWLPAVTFRRYQKIVDDRSVNIFSGSSEETLPLLLQHLQRPEFRGRIEDDLGVELRDISLRSQVQLLRYLSDQDPAGYTRLLTVLNRQPDSAHDIAESFLAFGENPDMAETILNVAELLEADPKASQKLFHAYASFTNQAERLAYEILATARDFSVEMPTNDFTMVFKKILQRGNRLFPSIVEHLKNVEPDQRSAVANTAGVALEREGLALIRSAYSFQEVSEQLAAESAPQGDAKRAALTHRLERAFRAIVLEERDSALPTAFLDSVVEMSNSIEPERLPSNEPLYFPVGISKDLPAWERVLAGEQRALKPIDIYAFLFWLENQNRPVELVVCDTMQRHNYEQLYADRLGDQPEKRAAELARTIGQEEARRYQETIDAYHFEHITIVPYDEFVGRHQEAFDQQRGRLERLAEHPTWSKAIDAMVQESVGQTTTPEEKRRFRGYALEEVAWILSTDGTKVSHMNEARYDVVAAVIRAVEQRAQEQGTTFEGLEEKGEIDGVLGEVRTTLEQYLNTMKSRAKRDTPRYQYADRALTQLRLISKPEHRIESGKAKNIEFNFAIPETGAASFGWRGAGQNEESVVGFREPYSTYFAERGKAAMLESDQVIADPDEEVNGKILALPKEKQQAYAEQVLKPLIAHFLKYLESDDHFQTYKNRIGLGMITREQLVDEFRNAVTIPHLLEVVQSRIVRPAQQEASAYIV